MNMPLPGLGQSLKASTLLRPERCEKCKWHAAVANQPHLECRRNPPTPSVIPTNRGLQTICTFAIVQPDAWCGEFKVQLEGIN